MFLQQSLKLWKEKFFTLFFLEFIFFFASFFFLVFAKQKLATYILQIQQFTTQAAALQQGTDQAYLTQFLSNFQHMTNQALVFIYIIIPLVFFLLFFITQSLVWKTIKGQEVKKTKRFFWNIFLITLIAFVLSILFAILVPSEFSVFDATDTAIIKTIVALIICFFMHVFIAVAANDTLFETIKKTGSALRKWYKLILPFLFYVVVFGASLFLFLSLFVTYTTGKPFLLPTIPLTLYLLFCMVLLIWVKIVFWITVVQKNNRYA